MLVNVAHNNTDFDPIQKSKVSAIGFTVLVTQTILLLNTQNPISLKH